MDADYELLDFGHGRKLERFGMYVLDRPSPPAELCSPSQPGLWRQAHARFTRTSAQTGAWSSPSRQLPRSWQLTAGGLTLELRPTEFGHVGVFMEQLANWEWLDRHIRRAARPLKILNLFAHTGGSTLAAAAAGAEVVHVDAARNIVQWAHGNAALSGLAGAPIRWIVEDAFKFVRRELKRGHEYQGVILDPPSYGHGPGGESFKLTDDLMPLLEACGQLTRTDRSFLLMTCHSEGYGPAELEACLSDAVFGSCAAGAARGIWS